MDVGWMPNKIIPNDFFSVPYNLTKVLDISMDMIGRKYRIRWDLFHFSSRLRNGFVIPLS